MQREQNRASRNIKTSMYKSNLQEIGAHGCMLSSPSPPGSCLRRHLPSLLYSCYKIYACIFCFHMAFSILSVCQPYLVHLSFQNVFLSKTSKITLYFNWSLLCCFISYFYALVWFIFSGSITLHYLFAAKLELIHLKWIMCDQNFTSMIKRCNTWSFASGTSTVTQRSIMFCFFQSCHVSTPNPPVTTWSLRNFKYLHFWVLNVRYIWSRSPEIVAHSIS